MWLISHAYTKKATVEFISERISTCQIEVGGQALVLIGVYLTANDGTHNSTINHTHDLCRLELLVEELENERKKFLIMGDFNSDPMRHNKMDELLCDMMKRNRLQLVDLSCSQKFNYTYEKGERRSWIDHVISSSVPNLAVECESTIVEDEANTSDHLGIKTVIEDTAIPIRHPKVEEEKSSGH
jgi:endonuclease/exonuclease/phosphatase family metal-dependent hydrolase